MFSTFPNRFKYRQNAHLPSLFSFYSLQFQIVSITVTMHALETMIPPISLQFQIVSNYIRIHALETLSSFFLQFKIVSNTVMSEL